MDTPAALAWVALDTIVVLPTLVLWIDTWFHPHCIVVLPTLVLWIDTWFYPRMLRGFTHGIGPTTRMIPRLKNP